MLRAPSRLYGAVSRERCESDGDGCHRQSVHDFSKKDISKASSLKPDLMYEISHYEQIRGGFSSAQCEWKQEVDYEEKEGQFCAREMFSTLAE